MKNINKFLRLSDFHIFHMKKCLYGDEKTGDIGLLDFKNMAIDAYNDLQKFCRRKAYNVDKNSSIGKFIAEKCLTTDDCDNLFSLIEDVSCEVSPKLIKNGYVHLTNALYRLSPNKRAKVFNLRGKVNENIREFAAGVDTITFLNTIFKSYLNDQRDMTRTLMLDSKGAKYRPTAKDLVEIKRIEETVSKMTQDYNEKVLDEYNGIIKLHGAVKDYIDLLTKFGILNISIGSFESDSTKYEPIHIDFSKVDPTLIKE